MSWDSRRMALCGVLSALAVTLLLLGGVLPLATYCAPLLAMAVLLPVLEEYGPRTAALSWCAVSLLTLLLAGDREMALVYLFFGWYPLLRPKIALLPSPALRVACRLVVCGTITAVLYGVVMALLGLEEALSAPWLIVLLVCGGVTFLLMDLVLARLSLLWRRKLRKRFFRE